MKSAAKPVRVVLADDHTLVRAGIRALLEKLPKVTVVGEASDGRAALDLVRNLQPDLVLMDIAMPRLDGLEAAARMVKEFPQVRVVILVILSMHRNEEYVWRTLNAGASGYLLKRAAAAELETMLRQVALGKIYLSKEFSNRFPKFPLARGGGSKSPLEQLTVRQREILQLIAESHNTKEIAEILKISAKTVEYHRKKLMNGLNVHDVPGLVRLALRAGLVSPES